MLKVCVVGLGVIGTPVARYIKRRGFDVYGFDIEKRKIRGIKTFIEWKSVPECNIYIVATPTKQIINACRKIQNRDCLLIIESTSPVGTCRKLFEKHEFKYVVHCPHRYFEGDPVKHGVCQLRVIGAVNKKSLKMGLKFYHKLGVPLHISSSIETAELTKIAENAYRFVQIAFAEELRVIAEINNISFKELREACNTKWNVNLLEAKEGIGRICLPQDIRLLINASKDTDVLFLKSAIHIDELYKKSRRKRKCYQ